MNELNKIIQNLDKVIELLSALEEENFYIILSEINKIALENKEFENQLKINSPQLYELQKNQVNGKTKLIMEKFDNILHGKKSESEAILSDLKRLRSEKNAIRYRSSYES